MAPAGFKRRLARVAATVGVALVAVLLVGCDTTPVMLQGRVTFAIDEGAGGVPVELYANDTEALVSRILTDASGLYRLRSSIVPDGTYRLKIHGRWWPTAGTWADAQPITLTSTAPTTIDAVVELTATLSGAVVDDAGVPLAGILVLVVRSSDRAIVAAPTTAADGTFTTAVAVAGDHEIILASTLIPNTFVSVGGSTPTTFDLVTGDKNVGTIDITTGLPYTPPATGPFTDIAAGAYHTCALENGGTISCWGPNLYGMLGDGTMDLATIPIAVNGIVDAAAISGGEMHTCALRENGAVSCWGANDHGQLGAGSNAEYSLLPVTVTGITDATAISAEQGHTCAILQDGALSCWGANGDGQLGNGTTTQSPVPVPVAGITDAIAVSAGYLHTCAVREDGGVSCWGDNAGGALGNGTTTQSLTPVTVSGITDATAVSAGEHHTCALLADGTVTCWGSNDAGQLGNGTTVRSLTPIAVSGVADATAITVGAAHGCALLESGAISCWGLGSEGQLGNGTTNHSSVPVAVNGITDAASVAAGYYHTCVVLRDGTAACWGQNYFGQLGNGTTIDSVVPVPVATP